MVHLLQVQNCIWKSNVEGFRLKVTNMLRDFNLQNRLHSRKHGQQHLTFDWAKLRVTMHLDLMQAPLISPLDEIIYTWSVIRCSTSSYLNDMICNSSWILTPSRNLVPRSEGFTFVPTFCSLMSFSLIRCCSQR